MWCLKIKLQPRDLEILVVIQKYGVISSRQIGQWFFARVAKTTVLRRIRLLEKANFIKRGVTLDDGTKTFYLGHQGRQYFLAVFALLFASQALVANALILHLAFGFLILHLACNQNSRYIAALGNPAVRYLGSISYGMYVWQSFIISTGPSRRLIHDPWLAFIVVILLSALSWHFIERPLASFRHRIRPRKPGAEEI